MQESPPAAAAGKTTRRSLPLLLCGLLFALVLAGCDGLAFGEDEASDTAQTGTEVNEQVTNGSQASSQQVSRGSQPGSGQQSGGPQPGESSGEVDANGQTAGTGQTGAAEAAPTETPAPIGVGNSMGSQNRSDDTSDGGSGALPPGFNGDGAAANPNPGEFVDQAPRLQVASVSINETPVTDGNIRCQFTVVVSNAGDGGASNVVVQAGASTATFPTASWGPDTLVGPSPISAGGEARYTSQWAIQVLQGTPLRYGVDVLIDGQIVASAASVNEAGADLPAYCT